MNLLLVRHGLTDWNEEGRLLGRIDIGLNARGREQVATLAGILGKLPIRRVVSSPQQRAQKSAAPIADALGLAVETDPGIDEVWLGRWQGKLLGEVRGDPDLERYLEDPTYECDAIEPIVEVQERMVAVTERLRAENEGQSVVLVPPAPVITAFKSSSFPGWACRSVIHTASHTLGPSRRRRTAPSPVATRPGPSPPARLGSRQAATSRQPAQRRLRAAPAGR